jgi:hypothetical protein
MYAYIICYILHLFSSPLCPAHWSHPWGLYYLRCCNAVVINYVDCRFSPSFSSWYHGSYSRNGQGNYVLNISSSCGHFVEILCIVFHLSIVKQHENHFFWQNLNCLTWNIPISYLAGQEIQHRYACRLLPWRISCSIHGKSWVSLYHENKSNCDKKCW